MRDSEAVSERWEKRVQHSQKSAEIIYAVHGAQREYICEICIYKREKTVESR